MPLPPAIAGLIRRLVGLRAGVAALAPVLVVLGLVVATGGPAVSPPVVLDDPAAVEGSGPAPGEGAPEDPVPGEPEPEETDTEETDTEEGTPEESEPEESEPGEGESEESEPEDGESERPGWEGGDGVAGAPGRPARAPAAPLVRDRAAAPAGPNDGARPTRHRAHRSRGPPAA